MAQEILEDKLGNENYWQILYTWKKRKDDGSYHHDIPLVRGITSNSIIKIDGSVDQPQWTSGQFSNKWVTSKN